MKQKKLRAYFFGRWAEGLACAVLLLKGYRIVKRNLRTPLGEIDIIAKKKQSLCFIEVKARSTLYQAHHALRPVQQKRIIHAARTFLSVNERYSNHDIRFDFIAIAPFQWPQHIKNAWWDTT